MQMCGGQHLQMAWTCPGLPQLGPVSTGTARGWVRGDAAGARLHDGRMRGRQQGDGSTSRWLRHDWWGVVLEAPDARALAEFYAALLGWMVEKSDDGDAAVAPQDGVAYIGFQTAPTYVRPVWPPVEGAPQMTMHLDFEVSDLEAAVAHAIELGAEQAEHQPQDNVRVLLDPAGHPFCLYTGG
ncbi:hypothetical protein BH20ACT6_BH20ACT6_13480 [soil metagenome]